MFTGKWAAAPDAVYCSELAEGFFFLACHDIDCAIEESLPTVLVLMSPKANWKRDIVPWKTEIFECAS